MQFLMCNIMLPCAFSVVAHFISSCHTRFLCSIMFNYFVFNLLFFFVLAGISGNPRFVRAPLVCPSFCSGSHLVAVSTLAVCLFLSSFPSPFYSPLQTCNVIILVNYFINFVCVTFMHDSSFFIC